MKIYFDGEGNKIIDYEDGCTSIIPKEAIGLVTVGHPINSSLELDKMRARVESLEAEINSEKK